MNRLDVAASELVSIMSDGPTVRELEGRGNRRRRRRVLVRVFVVCTAIAVAVGVALSSGHKSAAPQIAVSPTTTVRTAAATGPCGSMTQEQAMAVVSGLNGMRPGNNLRAKLMTVAEAMRAIRDGGSTQFAPLPPQGLLWLVYVQGSIRPEFDIGSGSYLSALYYLDANTGRVIGVAAGPRPVVPNWNTLSSRRCTSANSAEVRQNRRPEPTTAPIDGALNRVPSGPNSQALRSIVAPIVPAGSLLLAAYDIVSREQVAELIYALPSGQQLQVVRERLLTDPGSPRQLIRDPTIDSLTRLPTGSRLLRLGHMDAAQQVILGRPNGTTINLILSRTLKAGAPQPSEAQRRAVALANLNWLTTAVEQHLDRPSSDIN